MKNIPLRKILAMGLLTAGCFATRQGQAQSASAIAPTITSQPADQTADYGDNLTLSVSATGVPLHFQWRKNGKNLADYDNVAGAHTEQLTLVGVAQRDVGDYSVVVGNTAGVVTSAVAKVTVNFKTVFTDDFESGTLTNWTAFRELPGVGKAIRQFEAGRKSVEVRKQNKANSAPRYNVDGLCPIGTRLTNSIEQNLTPGGGQSAQVTRSRDKMYHNLGEKLAGRVKATYWIYDDGDQAASCFGELRGYTGAGHAIYTEPGGLKQLFAIGRYNLGVQDKVKGMFWEHRLNKWTEKPNRAKYQGKVERGKATGSGWFNLNAPGAPDRSVGWHKFEIVRAADGTNVDFYVDGKLGRHITGADHVLLDCVTIGSLGMDDTPVNAWFDDIKVEAVPWRYDSQSKDTAGKGFFDLMQLRETGADPQTYDPSQISTVFEANGVAGSGKVGRWAKEGNALCALDERGAAEYAIQAPADNVYRIEIEGRGYGDTDKTFQMPVIISIDGEHLGRFLLRNDAQTNGFVRCFTPMLKAGTHTLRVYWDGARSYRFLRLEAVRLQALAGADANQNGVKDWVENRLLVQSGVENVPTESIVSPVCVEGRGHYLSLMQCRAGAMPDATQPVPIYPGAGHRWYGNVPLSPDRPTRVQLLYQNSSLEENQQIVWRVTNLLKDNNMILRQGDSLLLSALPATNSQGEVRINVIGVTNYVTDAATPIPHRFDQPGTFTIVGVFHGDVKASRAITVKVVGASFEGPAAAWVGHGRYWDCTNLPPEVVLDADPRLAMEPVPESVRQAHIPVPPPLGPNGRQYRITIDAAEPRVVLARLGTNGPVLASIAVQGFRLFDCHDTYLRRTQRLKDGSQVIETAFIFSPNKILSDGILISLFISVSGVTFEDGTVTRTLTASDFDESGICRARFIRKAGILTSVCHTTKVIQGGVIIGRPAYEQ
jgi:hypothetical protein